MITTKHKKAVILSALMFSLTGASAYAQAPGIAGSQNGMSQSSMIDVKSGQATGKVGEITDKTDKAASGKRLCCNGCHKRYSLRKPGRH